MPDLIKSSDVEGLHLTGRDGEKLGTVREFFVDFGSGQMKYLIVEIAALLGAGGKFHPVPWRHVTYDAASKQMKTTWTKNELKGAPSYDREQLANSAYGWDRQADEYFDGHH